MSEFGKLMRQQQRLNPELFLPNYDDRTRVLGPVPEPMFVSLHRANEKDIPQKIYGMPNSYSSYRNYDALRDAAITGDADAIQTITNIALNV